VAHEKAGIIKEGVPVVTGVEDDEVLDILRKTCEEKNCDFLVSKEHGTYTLKEGNLDAQIFDLKGLNGNYEDLKILLLGKHQLKNAHISALTCEVLKSKGIDIPKNSIKQGFEKTRWPARLEVVHKSPVIILDCAHNPAGMSALNTAMDELFGERKITVIMGIMRDKDIPGIVKEIAPRANQIKITKPEFERAAEPTIIESEAKKYCDNVTIVPKVSEAVETAIQHAVLDDIICISGSIFNVSEAMEALIKKGIIKPS
jgi:dihydrofolate synthase/folylpolyglutamate synthase